MKKTIQSQFGIQITHPDGTSGWVVGGNGDCLTFKTEAAASKALKQLLANDNYSWHCQAVVARITR